MSSKSVYELSDKAISLLNKKAIKRFEKARKDCAALDFDELNVIKVCKSLYEELDADNRKAFLDLAIMVYKETKPNGKIEKDDFWKDWLESEILSKPNDVTHYIYTNEVDRKRDRMVESVNSTGQKKIEFERGLRYWSMQTTAYCDIITDEVRLKAFKDAGVKYVRWITEKDDKVCDKCKPRDGKIYRIDRLPPKSHLNCRCYVVPVSGENG